MIKFFTRWFREPESDPDWRKDWSNPPRVSAAFQEIVDMIVTCADDISVSYYDPQDHDDENYHPAFSIRVSSENGDTGEAGVLHFNLTVNADSPDRIYVKEKKDVLSPNQRASSLIKALVSNTNGFNMDSDEGHYLIYHLLKNQASIEETRREILQDRAEQRRLKFLQEQNF